MTRKDDARRTDLLALDHYPECPACGDPCGRLAEVCAACGASLWVSELDLASFVRVGSRAMRVRRRTAQLREDRAAREGTAI